jgi:hypothetical protein
VRNRGECGSLVAEVQYFIRVLSGRIVVVTTRTRWLVGDCARRANHRPIVTHNGLSSPFA